MNRKKNLHAGQLDAISTPDDYDVLRNRCKIVVGGPKIEFDTEGDLHPVVPGHKWELRTDDGLRIRFRIDAVWQVAVSGTLDWTWNEEPSIIWLEA